MRVDFVNKHLSSDEDQNWLRMMRGARAVAASIVIAVVAAATFSSLERAPGTPLLDATGGNFNTGTAATTAIEPLGSKSAPAATSAPASTEEWKDPTLNPRETTGLLG